MVYKDATQSADRLAVEGSIGDGEGVLQQVTLNGENCSINLQTSFSCPETQVQVSSQLVVQVMAGSSPTVNLAKGVAVVSDSEEVKDILTDNDMLVTQIAVVENTDSVPDEPEEPEGQPPESLEEARQLWSKRNIEHYVVTAQVTCYCPQDLVQPIRLEVESGTVVSSKGLKQPLKNLSEEGAQRMTVEGLFRFIEEAKRRKAQTLEVSYDVDYGFPTRINYDGHTMIADDERQYRLSDFDPGALR